MVSRAERSSFADWWWTIDRWLLERVRQLLREHPDERFAIRLSAATLADSTAGDAAVALVRDERDIAEQLTQLETQLAG